jgi:tetratricopeptide (TPR) repeat protein
MLRREKQILAIYLFLTVITFIAFWQLNQCDFINFDDPEYVTENVSIENGITMEAMRWAFTTGHVANWHPLTWISHILDVQLFGLKPQWHHLTNLLFHIANTLLLFFVFHRMTKAPWKSAFVAALFALHPLHVESVAWVSERKDVLSTFFWMLTMGAYIHYVERPRLKNYLAVLIFFALGLMAKAMLVTLPFVLLLLDYWPLQRFEPKKSAQEIRTGVNKSLSANQRKGKSSIKHAVQTTRKEEKPADHKYQWALVRPLLREKIPLLALTALSCIVTYIAQQKVGAVKSIEAFPPGVRISNAFVSYIIYIRKMIWPDNLAVFYPHPGLWPLWQVLGAILLLIAVTISVIRTAKRLPYLTMGWLWFTGTLVPVIGIVQVGDQAMADRYTYIPLIGLFIMAAWGIPELLKKWRYRKETLFASSALILPCLLIVTWTQVGYWRNSITLYDHALKVTNRNDTIYNNRGDAFCPLGNFRQAISDYDRAIEINPKYAEAYNHRGVTYGKLGAQRQAIPDFEKAIEINPKYAEAYNNRGVTYGKLGAQRQAISDYDRAIEINTKYEEAYYNRGVAYGELGDQRQAISDYDRAIEINPKYAEAYNNRGAAYGMLDNLRQAIEDFDKAIEMNPKYAEAYKNRGVTYGKLGNFRQAIPDFEKAIEINPKYAEAYNNRGVVYGKLGNFRQAIPDFEKAIEINPKYAEAYKNRGVTYDKLNDQRQATEDMKTAARLDNEDAKNYLGRHGVNW